VLAGYRDCTTFARRGRAPHAEHNSYNNSIFHTGPGSGRHTPTPRRSTCTARRGHPTANHCAREVGQAMNAGTIFLAVGFALGVVALLGMAAAALALWRGGA
jgi:hypothetical protein